jgi:anti-sigma regulatory factor (Ser/Thr protein kinase)
MQPIAEKTWQIQNRMEALAEAAKEVFAWLADLPLSSRARYSTGLAVEEIVTNAIKYGYDDVLDHFIRLHIIVERDNLRLIFEDDGHPFDPTRRPPPDIEAIVESHRAGGLGIELVRRMCEKMVYERIGDRNRLTLLIRRLQPDDTQFISLSSLL